jgi:hydroxymethylpyrimidine kinase/phosphomethylpyrimidine kinase/thiamine-phosphate diphosphorylase
MTTETKPAVLLIGGLDPQGCAGIAADIATVKHHDCHALPLITGMTEQTSEGLTELGAVSPEKLLAQFENCRADFDIAAVKIGLIPNLAIAECIKQILQQLEGIPVVLDPVLASSSGGEQVAAEVQDYISTALLPRVTLLTPNLPELNLLVGVKEPEQGADELRKAGLHACLVKGGHSDSQFASDYFVFEETGFYCYQEKRDKQVRGTGCVMASSIAAHLASGQDIRDAVVLAKAYVSRGIRLSEKAGPYQVITHSREPMKLEDIPRLCYQSALIGKQFEFPACPQRLGIYPVVDSNEWIKKLVDEGIQTIQLRVKDRNETETWREIKQALSHLNGNQVCFFVNDHWQLAIEAGAYGVHLGQEDLHDANLQAIAEAGLRLGISTHSYWELARALAVNPSYIALGPIYETTSKQMPFSPQGIERLQQWVDILSDRYPVVAIGGINHERACELQATGVGSVAMITAITLAEDYRATTQELLSLWQ